MNPFVKIKIMRELMIKNAIAHNKYLSEFYLDQIVLF